MRKLLFFVLLTICTFSIMAFCPSIVTNAHASTLPYTQPGVYYEIPIPGESNNSTAGCNPGSGICTIWYPNGVVEAYVRDKNGRVIYIKTGVVVKSGEPIGGDNEYVQITDPVTGDMVWVEFPIQPN